MNDVKIVSYNPARPMHTRYSKTEPEIDAKLRARIEKICTKICKAIGFEFNVVEVAVKAGDVYAVEFLNSAPNADIEYIYEDTFDWLVEKTSDYLIMLANKRKSKPALLSRDYSGFDITG